jgi:excisionase family DNA binding protein
MPSDSGVGEPLMLTYKQACAKAGISMSQLYRAMRAGEITPLKPGPRIRRIAPDELDAYVERLKAASNAKRPAA